MITTVERERRIDFFFTSTSFTSTYRYVPNFIKLHCSHSQNNQHLWIQMTEWPLINLIFDSIVVDTYKFKFYRANVSNLCHDEATMFTELSKITGCKSRASFKQRGSRTYKVTHWTNIIKIKNMLCTMYKTCRKDQYHIFSYSYDWFLKF